MARRSARLQKRSPTPSEGASSSSSWETAQSQSTPQPERLPSVVEDNEPAVKTPRKTVEEPVSKKPASQLPQSTSRTPKNRTPIKPAGPEMHPAHHHASTAKVLDEARWLGFQALGAQTAPPKAMNTSIGASTPSKTPVPAVKSKRVADATPEFRFRFKSPISGLSPKTSSILNDHKNTVAGVRPLFGADEFSAPVDSPKRKTAVPKGKMNRFSDVHMAEFKKMDSIANHASAFRADPSRFKPFDGFLKNSPSKADLNRPESNAKGPNKLKRAQSKMDVADLSTKASASTLKCTQSKMDVTESTTRITPTPLKRTQSKMDMTPSSDLPRAQSTVRIVPPSRNGRPSTQDGNPAAKRVKRTETDDAASTRPVTRDDQSEIIQPPTPAARKITSQTALPRLASRLMTPTKSSLARSQSVKAIKSTSMLPSLLKSPSTSKLFSPTSISHTMRDGVRESFRKTSSTLRSVRSILRTPSRKFSDDPEKVAAGTHMSPPPGLDMDKGLPPVPVTAPVKKHVNFTISTLERATQDELGKSPSPMKLRAGSEVPSGAIIYPTIQSGIEYPELPKDDEPLAPSPSRRLTFGGLTANNPGEFSFKSEKSIKFGPASAGTIRMVRKSDASSLVEGKKRKLDNFEETSDKENAEPPAAEEGRSPAKKMKTTPAAPPKTPSSASKLPRWTPNKRGGSISKSRLAFLATPKRNKA